MKASSNGKANKIPIIADCASRTPLKTFTPDGNMRRDRMLLYDSHQKGKMMIMIVKTPESQVVSPVAEGNRKEGGGREMRDLHKDT